MHAKYLCPYCKVELNVGGNIVLAARKIHDPGNKGVVLLHEEIGNYTVKMSGSLRVKEGDVVDFYCPLCLEDLKLEKGENLASLKYVDQEGKKNDLVLSMKYGERSTFMVDENKQIKSYGKKISKFIDPEWFLAKQ